MSLLPICSKIFEKLIFDSIYEFLDENNLFNSNQSGFRPNDSCIHQLIAITHNIFSAFDANPSLEVRGIFLDLSKAFDRVWHDGLPHKLQNNRIEGNLFKHIIAGNVAIWQGSRRKFRCSCFDIWLWIYIYQIWWLLAQGIPPKSLGNFFLCVI